jgi:hypothetical protein
MASGGHNETSILGTITAGANALTWTPPAAQALQSQMMDDYRNGRSAHHGSAGSAPSNTTGATNPTDAAASGSAAASPAPNRMKPARRPHFSVDPNDEAGGISIW